MRLSIIQLPPYTEQTEPGAGTSTNQFSWLFPSLARLKRHAAFTNPEKPNFKMKAGCAGSPDDIKKIVSA